MAENRIVLADASLTGQQALDAAGEAEYLVVQLGREWFAVSVKELRVKLGQWAKFGALDTPLADFYAAHPNALAPYRCDAIPQDEKSAAYKAGVKAALENKPLVLLDGETFAGLYLRGKTFRGGEQKGPTTLSAAGGAAAPGEAANTRGGASTPAQAEPRRIQAEIANEDGQTFQPSVTPLKKDILYILSFFVAPTDLATSIIKGRELGVDFGDKQEVEITIQLQSDDFTIFPETRPLTVPRTGTSKKARFEITPKHDGECLLNAVFLKDGNFLQVITLKFVVGEIYTTATLGREVNGVGLLQARDVSLTILHTGAAYQLILIAPGVAATALLPLKPDELKDMADEARKELLDIVYLKDGGKLFFQQSVKVTDGVRDAALQRLAAAGFRLYQRIFFGPSADEQCKTIGRKIRELAQKETLKVQIFSQDFVFPWALLYMADRLTPGKPDPALFLGMKHIIEHIPLQQALRVTDNRLKSDAGLAVSLNVNTDLDKTGVPLIGSQVKYWEALKQGGAQVSVVKRSTRDEVAGALADTSTADQVVYFYAHGISQDVGEQGGVGASALVMSGNGRLTLKDLQMYASEADQLPNAPLVFINACESAQLSPLVYDGFVPYFMAKGARGVIGTEVEVPALFAVEFAKRFFDRFLKGDPLGQIFLDLRKEFLQKENNPLGLLYALYVDGDTRVEPAVKAGG